jgi:hypothetical protein
MLALLIVRSQIIYLFFQGQGCRKKIHVNRDFY